MRRATRPTMMASCDPSPRVWLPGGTRSCRRARNPRRPRSRPRHLHLDEVPDHRLTRARFEAEEARAVAATEVADLRGASTSVPEACVSCRGDGSVYHEAVARGNRTTPELVGPEEVAVPRSADPSPTPQKRTRRRTTRRWREARSVASRRCRADSPTRRRTWTKLMRTPPRRRPRGGRR